MHLVTITMVTIIERVRVHLSVNEDRGLRHLVAITMVTIIERGQSSFVS